MVKHIVMFKLTEKTPENMDRATNSLRSLEGTIETLKSIEIGTDFLGSERALIHPNHTIYLGPKARFKKRNYL